MVLFVWDSRVRMVRLPFLHPGRRDPWIPLLCYFLLGMGTTRFPSFLAIRFRESIGSCSCMALHNRGICDIVDPRNVASHTKVDPSSRLCCKGCCRWIVIR